MIQLPKGYTNARKNRMLLKSFSVFIFSVMSCFINIQKNSDPSFLKEYFKDFVYHYVFGLNNFCRS